ncbi:MAG: tRNA (adenosine(37)-N6)-dimethylallyltransferase MiaA [Candidatus Peribacteraceae bacterium]|jgi:tRNA dimethylallyltransferase
MTKWQPLVSRYVSSTQHPLIVVLGPTASGKTAFSIKLAMFLHTELQRDAEVVNADSRQLYRFLNIGTAKVTSEEMQDVKHHLIDVLDPTEEASAGWYQKEARWVVAEVQERGSFPLLVGGSMLYVSAIIDDLSMAPVPDSLLRARLINEYDLDGGKSLYARLCALDPQAAQSVHVHNKPRLIRAVEICEIMQKPKSVAVPQDELRPAQMDDNGIDCLLLGISLPREELVQRIAQRTTQMFADGWVDEVRDLLTRGYGPDDPGMKSHGYREIIHVLQGAEPLDEQALIHRIAQQSCQYARRQMSWWRNDSRIHWIELSAQSVTQPVR